jgi:hypothetical protein
VGEVNPGGYFEIVVVGKPNSYRDKRQTAIDAAEYFKERNPKSNG